MAVTKSCGSESHKLIMCYVKKYIILSALNLLPISFNELPDSNIVKEGEKFLFLHSIHNFVNLIAQSYPLPHYSIQMCQQRMHCML